MPRGAAQLMTHVAAQPHIENTWGPEITRRLAARPRKSLAEAASAAVSSWCARRARSTEPPSTAGVMTPPRLRSEQSRTPPQLLQLELPSTPGHLVGAPVERPYLSSVPTTMPAERPGNYNSSLIAGMSLDGQWSAPPPSMMTAGVLPPLPSPHDPPSLPPSVPNAGEECWYACEEHGGACPHFCGMAGACCRQGFDPTLAVCGLGAHPSAFVTTFAVCPPILLDGRLRSRWVWVFLL